MKYRHKHSLFFLICIFPLLILSLSSNQSIQVQADQSERSSCSNRCSGEVESKALAYTDSEGNEYYEYLSSSIENLDQTDVKAGSGFGFQVITTYNNEWFKPSEVDGPIKVIAHFPSTDSYLPEEVELVPIKEVGSWENTWELPLVYIEKFSGHMFYNPDDNNRDPDDELLDGGNKWYTSFSDADGEYEIYIEIVGAGSAKLTDCQTICLNIKGSIFDDFVIRRVNPENPFPAGTGENWRERESLITELKDWYFDDTATEQPSSKETEWTP